MLKIEIEMKIKTWRKIFRHKNDGLKFGEKKLIYELLRNVKVKLIARKFVQPFYFE